MVISSAFERIKNTKTPLAKPLQQLLEPQKMSVEEKEEALRSLENFGKHQTPAPSFRDMPTQPQHRHGSQATASAITADTRPQLPAWNDALRAAPNELVRSSLFSAKNRCHERLYFKRAQICSIGDGEIRYTGQELRQDDETVWLQVLHLAKCVELGTTIFEKRSSFLCSVDWADTKANYERLHVCLDRLSATNLEITSKRLNSGIAVSLIRKYRFDDTSNLMQIEIEPEIQALFSNNNYTLSGWSQRLSLSAGLSTWLHAYYASHSKPFPIKLETIAGGAGIHFSQKSGLKRSIKKSLDELVSVGFLEKYDIKDDLVSVTRINTMT
jgi:hypothetical protein